MGILDTLGAFGPILTNYGANAARGNALEAQVNQNQANTANNLYRTQAQLALEGPSISAAQAAKGDYLANVQPFSFTGGTKMVGNIPVPQATGGLTPAVFGPNTRAAGQALSSLGLSRLQNPANFSLPQAPTLAAAPSLGPLASTSSILGTGASIAGALGKLGILGGGGGSNGSDDTGPTSIANGSTDPSDAAYNAAQNATGSSAASGSDYADYLRWLQGVHDPGAADAGGYQ